MDDVYGDGYGPDSAPLSKREKKRQSMSSRLYRISDMFEAERDLHYRNMLHNLQSTLYSLHVGENLEYLEELADMEESRDEGLVTLYLWQKYQMERADQEYQKDVESANQEHANMTAFVKDKLMQRLESQRKKLSEDKALLDIANDHSFFLSAMSPGGGMAVPGSPSGNNASSLDRRSLRRREYIADDYSGVSGGEGKGSGFASSRRRFNGTGASDQEVLSDRDLEALWGKDRETPNTRHASKSYQGVAALKPEEAMEDLNLIRNAVKRKKLEV
jgi:Sds3-like